MEVLGQVNGRGLSWRRGSSSPAHSPHRTNHTDDSIDKEIEEVSSIRLYLGILRMPHPHLPCPYPSKRVLSEN
jgi:hypothetical protein